MTVKLWQLVAAIACAALIVGIGFGRYVVPNDPVNSAGVEFEQHMNDAFKARLGDKRAQARIAERYGASTTATSEPVEPYEGTPPWYVRAAVPALEAYNADHGGYTGVTLATLQQQYDASLSNIEVVTASATSYCVQSTVGASSYYKAGPAANITPGTC